MLIQSIKWYAFLLCISMALIGSGCTTNFGANGVAPAGFTYNQAIAQTTTEQLLLNLVKLRYRDTPVFLEVDSVTTQRQYAGSASLLSAFPFSGIVGGASSLSSGASFAENPTVRYSPLHGEKFAANLLAPIPPETIVLLSTSGWSLERLLLCCVERIGVLSNAPSASGPTPAAFPDNSAFRQAAQIFRNLQSEEKLHVELVERKLSSVDGKAQIDTFLVIDDPDDAACTHLRSLLGVPAGGNRFRLVGRDTTQGDDDLLLLGRSVLGSLYALSHTVDAPEKHESSGLVTVSTPSGRSVTDWDDFHNGLFDVRVSKGEPRDAFVKVPYRGHWFWIADNDLDSKTSLNLLIFLLALQSADSEGSGPLLTLSASG